MVRPTRRGKLGALLSTETPTRTDDGSGNLSYDGGGIYTPPGTPSLALDDLTDVTITSPAAADRLRYNGSAWVNSSLIWRPVMVLDPSTGNYVVMTTGGGEAVLVEA